MTADPRWLERYRAGERVRVWHEFRQLGATVRNGPYASQAEAVCDEMAQRALRNVEVLIDRLEGDGYRFHDNDDDQTPAVPRYAPGPGAGRLAAWFAGHRDQVPMTVESWLRVVGDVWFVGTHPDWPDSAAADPLVIELEGARYPDDDMVSGFDQEITWTGVTAWGGREILPVAPDRLHKMNVSGGPPYGFVLPDGCVDALFVAETTMPFVDYLNWVFANGGFPARTGTAEWYRITSRLARDLLPL